MRNNRKITIIVFTFVLLMVLCMASGFPVIALSDKKNIDCRKTLYKSND
jgi:hypothetical protein